MTTYLDLTKLKTKTIIALVVAMTLASSLIVLARTSIVHAAPVALGTSEGITASACKTYNPAFGGVYQVSAIFTKDAATLNIPYYAATIRNGQPLQDQRFSGTTYWNNVVAGGVVNASAVQNDGVVLMINGKWNAGGPTTWSSGVFLPYFLPNC